jgi:hypothetical protein
MHNANFLTLLLGSIMNTTVKLTTGTVLKECNQISLVGFIHTVDNFASQLAFFLVAASTLNIKDDFFYLGKSSISTRKSSVIKLLLLYF